MNGLFNKLSKNVVKKRTQLICPSCGNNCIIDDDKCSACGYDITDYKEILFSCYNYYNDALENAKCENYLDCIINVSKYLGNYPLDEDANKLLIYSLVKLKLEEKAKIEIEKFEENFPMNPWIMDVEKVGLMNMNFPNIYKKDFISPKIKLALNEFSLQYTKYRIKTTNEILDLCINFYALIQFYKKKQNKKKKNSYKEIIDFYDKNFMSFISKKEIRIESFDGKNYNDLTDNEKILLDVIGTTKDKKLPDGNIKTIYPSIYVRAKRVQKEKVEINRLDK